MLTSAPFDNWWHNAYGLDVRIISPPHAVLAIGIFAIVVGALLLTLAQQNRADDASATQARVESSRVDGRLVHHELRAVPHGIRRAAHDAQRVVLSRSCRSRFRSRSRRWRARSSCGGRRRRRPRSSRRSMLVLMWTLQLFPATPKLGPIYQHVTHMVTLSFPLLVIVPAFLHRPRHAPRSTDKLGTSALAAIIGVVFVATFLAAQWPFATFLMHNPLARGPFFNAENFVYWMSPRTRRCTRRFDPPAPGSLAVRGAHAHRDGHRDADERARADCGGALDDEAFGDESGSSGVALASSPSRWSASAHIGSPNVLFDGTRRSVSGARRSCVRRKSCRDSPK